MEQKYPRLFSPIKLGNVLVQNRIVANPMSESYADRTLGGPGVVICGHCIVEPGRSSFASPQEPYAFHKYQVEKTRKGILMAHRTGARASIELHHSGCYARTVDYAVSSCGYTREDGVEVKAMTPAMMEENARLWAAAARDARDVGFDMVFLHFGHGWLAAQFLSPYFNHRTDEYGGSLENRARFPLQILKACREAVGPDFPMEMRISAYEWMPGGITFEDVLAFVKLAQPYLTSIQVSCGMDLETEANVHMAATNFDPHLLNREYAQKIREAVDIPVTLVGSVETPEEAEMLIEEGTCDMVALARALAADPFWPQKAREGRGEDIVPCLRCLQCYHISTNRRNVGCSVNPRYWNEDFVPLELTPVANPKRVVVIGAGPAGCKAALTAQARGHQVSLLEKEEYVGGALHYIAMEHYKEDVKRYRDYLEIQLKKSGVNLLLGCEATPGMIRSLVPDALIIAVGAKPAEPPIPGIKDHRVIGFHQAIAQPDSLGQRVVVIGGGTIGAEIALEQTELKGRQVTVVELGDKIAAQGNMLYRIALRQKMDSCGEKLVRLTNTSCRRITDRGVEVEDSQGNRQTIPADTVVIATGVRANSQLAESFFGLAPQCFMVGDCVKPRKIMEATYEGYAAAAWL